MKSFLLFALLILFSLLLWREIHWRDFASESEVDLIEINAELGESRDTLKRMKADAESALRDLEGARLSLSEAKSKLQQAKNRESLIASQSHQRLEEIQSLKSELAVTKEREESLEWELIKAQSEPSDCEKRLTIADQEIRLLETALIEIEMAAVLSPVKLEAISSDRTIILVKTPEIPLIKSDTCWFVKNQRAWIRAEVTGFREGLTILTVNPDESASALVNGQEYSIVWGFPSS